MLGWRYESADRSHPVVAGAVPPRAIVGGQQHRTQFCCYAVDDLDAGAQRVRAAGGEVLSRSDEHGPVADCRDTLGMRFALWQIPVGQSGERAAAPGQGSDDLVYLTMRVPDADIVRRFYAAVLGWDIQPSGTQAWQVRDARPMTGIAGASHDASGPDSTAAGTVVPEWSVGDVALAVERVRAAGGTATEPADRPSGRAAECTDDQGSVFYLVQLASTS